MHKHIARPGTPAQVKTEIERLSARLKMLHGGEAAVAAVKPDPAADPTGERLSAMLEWRRQRKAAISAEISRLERQLARLEAAQGLWGTAAGADGETSKNRGDLEGVGQSSSGKGSQEGAEGLRAVSHELVQWLEGNGAQVWFLGVCGLGLWGSLRDWRVCTQSKQLLCSC